MSYNQYMMMRSVNIILIACIITTFSICCSACRSKQNQQQHINIQYNSRIQQIKDKAKDSGIIDLSDGTIVNYDYYLGPQDPTSPDFNMVKIKDPYH